MSGDAALRLRRFAEDLRSCGEDLTPRGADDMIRRPEWWPADVAFIPLQAHAASLLAIVDEAGL